VPTFTANALGDVLSNSGLLKNNHGSPLCVMALLSNKLHPCRRSVSVKQLSPLPEEYDLDFRVTTVRYANFRVTSVSDAVGAVTELIVLQYHAITTMNSMLHQTRAVVGGVSGFGCRVSGLDLRVEGSRFRV